VHKDGQSSKRLFSATPPFTAVLVTLADAVLGIRKRT
jgi:hypothetical protein